MNWKGNVNVNKSTVPSKPAPKVAGGSAKPTVYRGPK
jgi:hypothetical protein